jgi:DNA polymerase delta subunit 3
MEGDEDCMSDAMDAVIVPKKTRKKKVKKEIPVGRNGLKKKRVVGTRQVMDDKGYMGALSVSFCFGPLLGLTGWYVLW